MGGCSPKSVTLSLAEHIEDVASLIESEACDFAGKYGKLISAGQPLPTEAASELDQIAKDCRLLTRPARCLRDVAAPSGD